MRVLDDGHAYSVDNYDGDWPQTIVFVKREGKGYPFNAGHHPGTNCQEVIRALIDRVEYLQRQESCAANTSILNHLRLALRDFELRAAHRHQRTLPLFDLGDIEKQPTCAGCGHIGCTGNHRRE
jgi:hypothetical protein